MSKKAIIVTVYNSENCGSYLQAYAMQQAMQRLGYEVAFLYRDITGSSHDRKKLRRYIVREIIRLHLKSAWRRYKQWYTYERLVEDFKVCFMGDAFYTDASLVVIGSDTIWNFDLEYFRNNADRYLGTVFKGKQVMTYAASVGNTSEDTFRKVLVQHGVLNHLSNILIRDSHTQKVLHSVSGLTSEKVCDPTLLLTLPDYCRFYNELKRGKFILIYLFSEINKILQDQIIKFARSRGFRIISMLKEYTWSDDFVPSSPNNMITYFSQAEAVVTDTFHGCAFSINFCKPFVALDENKLKVNDILASFNLTYRLTSTSILNENYLLQKLTKEEILTINAIRETSFNLLKNAVQ